MSSWGRTPNSTGSPVRGRVKSGVLLCNGLKQMCLENGCFELTYEDLFNPDLPLASKLKRLDDVFDFLEVERFIQPKALQKIEELLDTGIRKLNSPLTYELIPNIREIEERFGNPENGYLFQ